MTVFGVEPLDIIFLSSHRIMWYREPQSREELENRVDFTHVKLLQNVLDTLTTPENQYNKQV